MTVHTHTFTYLILFTLGALNVVQTIVAYTPLCKVKFFDPAKHVWR